MNLEIIEDAIRVWVKTATGLPDAQVYFANQAIAQPAAVPYITILIAPNSQSIGLPEIYRSQDLTRPNGQEVQQTPIEMMDISISIQAFAENTVSYPVPQFPLMLPTGQGITAVELLSNVQAALGLESVHAALNAAGIAPYDWGSIRRLDAIVNTYFEGRAAFELKAYVNNNATEFTGYINEVQAAGTLKESGAPDRSVTLDVVGS